MSLEINYCEAQLISQHNNNIIIVYNPINIHTYVYCGWMIIDFLAHVIVKLIYVRIMTMYCVYTYIRTYILHM